MTLLEWKSLPKVNSKFRESRSYAAPNCAKFLIRAICCYLSRQIGSGSTAKLILIDECLARDSSRFWRADSYAPGKSPPSFNKQFVRDYLETLDWDKTPPGLRLPKDVIEKTSAKYREVFRRLVGS